MAEGLIRTCGVARGPARCVSALQQFNGIRRISLPLDREALAIGTNSDGVAKKLRSAKSKDALDNTFDITSTYLVASCPGATMYSLSPDSRSVTSKSEYGATASEARGVSRTGSDGVALAGVRGLRRDVLGLIQKRH